jgi:tetratricopeptide (TPR) repeat protein
VWRLLPVARWFWGAIVLTLGLGVLTNLLFSAIRPEIAAIFRATALPFGLFLAAMAGLTIWSWISENRRQEARLESGRRQRFAVAKAIEELEPSDFGFQVIRHGDRPDPRYRPYYDEYISREAVPYDQIGLKDPTSVYDEDAIKDALREGKGFVLLGQPLDGKTRMLYEVVRRLPEYWVVRPGDTPTPSEAAFEIFEGRRVVFVLDDLNGYTQGIPDLKEFAARLDQRAISWAVAATCRDGSELSAVREALGTSLRRFYEDIPLKLGLVPLTADEKGRLARGVGKTWSDIESEHFPTPGAITMEAPLVFIRERFQSLAPEHKDTLRSAKLLTAAGILPYTHKRLEKIIVSIFRRDVQLGDSLDVLAAASLVRRPARQDPVQPDAAYLRDAVAYAEGRSPELDFPALAVALQEIGDWEGLFYLGNTYHVTMKNHQEAVNVYDRALQIQPAVAEISHNKGAALQALGRHTEAMSALERALELKPELPEALFGKGLELEYLGRHAEALTCFERTTQLRPDFGDAWLKKGMSLSQLNRPADAVAAYDRALELQPGLAAAWGNKAIALSALSRREEALAACERALQLQPDLAEVLSCKGALLVQSGRLEEALAACRRAVELKPGLTEAEENVGAILLTLGRTDEALQILERATTAGSSHPEAWAAFASALRTVHRLDEALAAADQAVILKPDFLQALREKGLVLAAMGKSEEAMAMYEQVLRLNPGHYEAWLDKGASFHAQGRYEEALAAFARAGELQPGSALVWNNQGVALNDLGRQEEALIAYERALAIQPDLPSASAGRTLTLEKLGRRTTD